MKRALLPLFVIADLVGDTTNHAISAAITTPPISTSWLSNISRRALVKTGNNVMIGGFIVEATQPKKPANPPMNAWWDQRSLF
jgi:hypothetical protein